MQYTEFAPDAKAEALIASVVRGLATSQPYVLEGAPPSFKAIPAEATDAQVARAVFDAPDLAAYHFTLLGAARLDCTALFALRIAQAGGLDGAGSVLDGETFPLEFFLLQAASSGSAAVVRALIAAGVNPNWVHKDGHNNHTALHWAVYSHHADAVAALVAAPGIDLMALDKRRTTPLACAMRWGDAPYATQLLAAGASPHDAGPGVSVPLFLAVQCGDVDIIQAVLDAGADPSAVDKKTGLTPLQLAITRARPQLVSVLLAAGADPSVGSTKKYKKGDYAMERGSTAYDFAAACPKAEIAEMVKR